MRQTIPPLDSMRLSLWFYHLGTLSLPDFFCHKQIVSSPPQQLPRQTPRECLFTLSITPSPRTALQPWACVCLGFCFPEVGQILKAWVCYFEKKTMQITWSKHYKRPKRPANHNTWGFSHNDRPNCFLPSPNISLAIRDKIVIKILKALRSTIKRYWPLYQSPITT